MYPSRVTHNTRKETMSFEFGINTPALVFPAITLLLLAYCNRFSTLSGKLRSMLPTMGSDHPQVKIFHVRIRLVQAMMILGIMGITCALISMLVLCVPMMNDAEAPYFFIASIVFTIFSLVNAAVEVLLSASALNLEINDMRGGR